MGLHAGTCEAQFPAALAIMEMDLQVALGEETFQAAAASELGDHTPVDTLYVASVCRNWFLSTRDLSLSLNVKEK